ncbi:MAG: M48 family metallopeptidase [Verrucomicrobiota bacterium]
MDFFDRQDKARKHTKLLVFYFISGVVLLIVSIYAAVVLLFTGISTSRHHRHYETRSGVPAHVALWQPQLLFGVTIGTLAVISLGSLTKTAQLSAGGSAVAEMVGARLVPSNTLDPRERRLLNVVEEMALASGVPVPQVYVMDKESGINAFAAGHTTSDAAITVTRGCMELLTRDELQGVVAHEFSHILNGDMRLNLRLMGIIFGILCLAVIGRVLLYTRSGNSKDRNALPLLGLVLIALGWVGVVFGRLIQAAVSRQREFLADASAVQFTRNPAGIAGALKKIGGLAEGSHVEAAQATEVSHMFFGNGGGTPLFDLMATHPPLADRIRAIDPAFDGVFPEVTAPAEELPELRPSTRSAPPLIPMPGMPRAAAGVLTAAVLPSLGKPTVQHLQYAVDLRQSIPATVREAATDALGASALIYGLLLSDRDDLRSTQLEIVEKTASPEVRREVERLLPDVQAIAHQAKLPLVDLALAGLRHLSADQYAAFSAAVERLIAADEEVDLFEYMLQKVVLRHLEPQFKPARKPSQQYYALRPLAPDCAVLLSALAHVGQPDAEAAAAAFQQGARGLIAQAQVPMALVPADRCDLPEVDAALNRLAQSVPQIRKNVLNACALTVAADGKIVEMEAELLRAIADTLDCPIPPFLNLQAA